MFTLPYFFIEAWRITNGVLGYPALLLAWIGFSADLHVLPNIEYLQNLDIQLEKNQVSVSAFGFLKLALIIFRLIKIIPPFIINTIYAIAVAKIDCLITVIFSCYLCYLNQLN